MAPWLLEKNKRIIPRPSNDSWTDEGDLAHQRAKDHLTGVKPLKDKHDPVWTYAKAVDRAKRSDSILLVEKKSPTFYDPGYLGTVDAAWFTWDGTQLDILDLKYGQGQDVEAFRNPQMMIYWRSLYEFLTACGLMEHMEQDIPVTLTIVQPRHWNSQKVDTWDTNVGELMNLTDVIGLQAEKIYTKRGLEFSPNEDTCRFCPARAVCIKKHEWELEHLPELEGDIPAMDMGLVSQLYDRRAAIKRWLDHIEKFVKDSVTDGGPLSELYQWQEGSRMGNTQWFDEKKTMAMMRRRFPNLAPSSFYTKKFMSPNQLMSMILDETGESVGKEEFEKLGLTFRPPAKKVIAPRKFGTLSSREEAFEKLRRSQEDS